MSSTIGHICGDDLSELSFVFDSLDEYGKPRSIQLGELLIVTDKMTREKYLIRVTNIGYGQKPEWQLQVARNHNRMESSSDISDEHEDDVVYLDEQPEQLFLKAYCEPVGHINVLGKFLTPRTLPSYFSPVRKLDKTDLDFMEEFLGDIPFGKLRTGANVLDIRVGLFGELLAKHVGIFAQTGGGKSNTMLRLTGGILEQEGKFGMLLLEPHGEYLQELKRHPFAKDNMVSFTQDDNGIDRQLRIAYSDLTVDHLMSVRRQLQWSEPQERFLREVYYNLGKDWLEYLIETPVNDEDDQTAFQRNRGQDSDFDEDVFGAFEEAIQNGQNKNKTTIHDDFPNANEDTIKVVKSKLNQIKNSPFLVKDRKVSDLNEILSLLDQGKVVLIDMAALGGLQELLLSSILTTAVLSRRKRAYIKDRVAFKKLPPISIVLEEAQRVLGKNGGMDNNIFAQVCNEGRKFGVGLLAITQQPKVMDPILLSQFNTIFILSISDAKDFEILSGVSKKPIHKLQQEIRSLQPGEAIISSPLSPFAVPAKVDYYDDYLKELKKNTVKVKKPTKSSFDGFV